MNQTSGADNSCQFVAIRGQKTQAPKARQSSQMPDGWQGGRTNAGQNANRLNRKNEKTPQPISFFNPGCF
jgi:hypothetical protein